MESKSTPWWRLWVLARLDAALIAFEFVLSVIFVAIGYLRNSLYFRGVGIGLVIAWVTSGIAVLYKRSRG